MKESDILFESGEYFVLKNGKSVSVNKNLLTHSLQDSVYSNDPDGISIAICRCKYLAKSASKKV